MHNKTHPTPSMINEKILLIEYVLQQIQSTTTKKLTKETTNEMTTLKHIVKTQENERG